MAGDDEDYSHTHIMASIINIQLTDKEGGKTMR